MNIFNLLYDDTVLPCKSYCMQAMDAISDESDDGIAPLTFTEEYLTCSPVDLARPGGPKKR